MKYLIAVIICALLGAGCGTTLSGQPSWFRVTNSPLASNENGPDFYNFESNPYWFEAFGRWVDEAMAKAYKEQIAKKPQEANISSLESGSTPSKDGLYWIPGDLPYPAKLEDVPLNDDGVTLSFNITPADDPAVLVFNLTLHSERRNVWREDYGHKDPNAGSFLFAFFLDGKAITWSGSSSVSWGEMEHHLFRLLRPGETRTISFHVDARSIDNISGINHSQRLQIVAAFSERHSTPHYDKEYREIPKLAGFAPPPEDGKPHKQVLVRSNAVALKWNGKAWRPVHN